ncbi:MAG: Asp-tRNA(Asn)/Glu-tRNA(Gln) amidotransferase subunit GatB [Cyanobacteria bacterium]|nr:Asp-tRNA(Asn)/Glu-tRNA(Gln) amidotransferase subunit GatB [Cyanobacteriota bacterium]
MATATKQEYNITIGLEVHAQLKTESKLFCSCSTEFGKEPNANTCPVCMGYPGVLPVLNKQAVAYAITAGLALGCKIDLNSRFDRKQYFYPDLPKGYQISQFDNPICNHGKLTIPINNANSTHENPSDARLAKSEQAELTEPSMMTAHDERNAAGEDFRKGYKDVRILRIHMEEDAGKLVHAGAERLHGSDHSLVDLNRASTPLIEIVSEPDINSAEEAVTYVKELRKVLLYTGVCDGNMQEGSLRCDVNISLNKPGQPLGTRAEIKNVNSFRSISRAIEYEYKRQSQILDEGGKIVQETRLFEEGSGKTHSMRSKEEAHDYRYFPEPDLLPVTLEQKQVDDARAALPELPQQKKTRYIEEFQINEDTATTLTDDLATAHFFEEVLTKGAKANKAANWIIGPIAAYLNENKKSLHETKLSAELLAEMIVLIEKGTISDNIAKNDIINELLENGSPVAKLIEDKGLAQITDTDAIEAIVQEVIDANPKQVEQFKSGNDKIQGFFVGQIMKKTEGKAPPALVNQLLGKLLK